MSLQYIKAKFYKILSHITFGKNKEKYLYKYAKNKKKYQDSQIITLAHSIQQQLDCIKYIHIPASVIQKEVFAKYKNIHSGKKVVVVGSGPTLKNFTHIEDAIYVGVNHTFTNKNLKLDYLFIQDFLKNGVQAQANIYEQETCKKFYGRHYLDNTPSQRDVEIANAEPYYFIDQPMPTSHLAMFSPDITTRPLHTWSSVIFPALEFALWTNPAKLYLVGCDCSAGHYIYGDAQKMIPHADRVLYGWDTMAKFIKVHYPNMQIYSVNPVGLKGLFEDIYQNNKK